MTDYTVFAGGNKYQWPEQARLDSGFVGTEWINCKLDTFSVKRAYRLYAGFDGSNAMWGDFLNRTVLGGAFADGDSLEMLITSRETLLKGLFVKLPRALPSGIGLTITVQSSLDAGNEVPAAGGVTPKDTLQTVQLVIPPGSAAGVTFIPPLNTIGDFTIYGASLSVQFNYAKAPSGGGSNAQAAAAAAAAAAAQLLDTRAVAFALVLGVDDFQDEMPPSCVSKACPTVYPPLDCIRLGGDNPTPAWPVPGAVSTAPTPTVGGAVSGSGGGSRS